jgi:hypothetical protein
MISGARRFSVKYLSIRRYYLMREEGLKVLPLLARATKVSTKDVVEEEEETI